MKAPFDDDYIQLLAHKWKLGTLTEKEREDFDTWYKEHDDNLLELSQDYAEDRQVLRDRILTGIQSKITMPSEKPVNRMSPRWISIAVAAILMATIGTAMYMISQRAQSAQTDSTPIQASQIGPGSDKAILRLSGGQEVILSANGAAVAAEDQNVAIHTSKEGALIYNVSPEGAITQAHNTLITPKGGQYKVQLPDGTLVWLNAASSLEYPVSFNGRPQRTVRLNGEAYFQVAKDKDHPFIVQTDRQEIRVLGTHFNINSYRDESYTVTTLEEGSVMVSSGSQKNIIRPGQQTRVADAGQISTVKADMEAVMAWRKNEMVFKDASIREIMRQVSRWYDIDIEYSGKISEDTFNGTLDRTANLDVILKMLATIQVHFTVEQTPSGKKLIIRP